MFRAKALRQELIVPDEVPTSSSYEVCISSPQALLIPDEGP